MTPSANTFAISRLLQSLGVKGGQQPGLDAEAYTPVLVMGDFSKTMASEPLEARGLIGSTINSGADRVVQLQLHAIAPGGVIIETFQIMNITGTTLETIFVNILDESHQEDNYADVIDIGGRPARSVVSFGQALPYTAEPMAMVFGGLGGSYASSLALNQRIYVPPGKFLFLQNGDDGADAMFFI
ncbi:unnamed protein product, partial [marine sediment metagenome]